MRLPKKLAALVLGAFALLTAVTFANQNPAGPAVPGPSGDTLQIDKAQVDWILKSDVSALTDGVVEKIELDHGKIADKQGAVIGTLYKRKAELVVAKAEVAANNVGAVEKAKAQYDQAVAVVARNENLTRRDRTAVSREEQEKALAELNVAKALRVEAQENQALAKAELELAKQQLEEHTIRAPFPGVVFEVLKGPGERVSTGDAIVRIGNLEKLRVFAYIPLDYVGRVKEGSIVEIRPRMSGGRGGATSEGKTYRGVVTFVDPQIQPVAETAVRVYADFNNADHELRPGLKVSMTIHLDPGGAKLGAVPAAGPGSTLPETPPANPASSNARTASSGAGNVELPPLPR